MNLCGKELKIFSSHRHTSAIAMASQKLFNSSDRIHFPIAEETGDSVGAKSAL